MIEPTTGIIKAPKNDTQIAIVDIKLVSFKSISLLSFTLRRLQMNFFTAHYVTNKCYRHQTKSFRCRIGLNEITPLKHHRNSEASAFTFPLATSTFSSKKCFPHRSCFQTFSPPMIEDISNNNVIFLKSVFDFIQLSFYKERLPFISEISYNYYGRLNRQRESTCTQ